MNKQLQHKLNKTAEICQQMLNGEKFSVSGSEIDCVPVSVATKTAMDKKEFELKRGAKPVGCWSFYHCRGGWIYADVYLMTSFKRKPKKETPKNKPSRKTQGDEIPVFIPKVSPIEYEFLRKQCVKKRKQYAELRDESATQNIANRWQHYIDEVYRLEQFFAQLIEKCGGGLA